MTRDTDRAEALRADLVRAIVDDTGVSETVAMPFASSVLKFLQEVHGGGQLYIPNPAKQYDLLQIRAALERGDSIPRVCREHCISRAKLYRMFPGGVPGQGRKRA